MVFIKQMCSKETQQVLPDKDSIVHFFLLTGKLSLQQGKTINALPHEYSVFNNSNNNNNTGKYLAQKDRVENKKLSSSRNRWGVIPEQVSTLKHETMAWESVPGVLVMITISSPRQRLLQLYRYSTVCVCVCQPLWICINQWVDLACYDYNSVNDTKPLHYVSCQAKTLQLLIPYCFIALNYCRFWRFLFCLNGHSHLKKTKNLFTIITMGYNSCKLIWANIDHQTNVPK